MWERKSVVTIGICIILGLLLTADILARHPEWTQGHLIVVADQRISNQVVVLDGYEYTHCVFTNVTFEYDGGNVGFNYNDVHGAVFRSENNDINRVVFFMARLGMLRTSVRSQDGSIVTPGATWH